MPFQQKKRTLCSGRDISVHMRVEELLELIAGAADTAGSTRLHVADLKSIIYYG
jgi:hypothetical protein